MNRTTTGHPDHAVRRHSPSGQAPGRAMPRAAGLALWLLLLAGTAVRAEDISLPERNPTLIKAQIRTLLRDMGDLQAYLHEVKPDGTVVVKTFQARPGCATLPRPTVLGEALNDTGLTTLLRAVTSANQALDQGVPLPVEERQAACIDHASSGETLPELPRQAILDSLTDLLRRLGDFGAYVVMADRRGAIVVKTFTHKHRCRTMPAPALPSTAVPTPVLARAQAAVDAANQQRLARQPVTLRGKPAACQLRPG